ncbi:MAG: hypothetical protein AAB837_00175 [Patescibacteria group bacterium]
MEYEQNIPFYITKFRDYPWKIYESDHYIFHVEAESLANKEIEEIKNRQEFAYVKITQTLELKDPEQKIKYYFYPSQDKKAELMGDGWYGQSIYKEFEVHAVYNEKDKVVGEHEDTHLLTLEKNIKLFEEVAGKDLDLILFFNLGTDDFYLSQIFANFFQFYK